MGKAHFPVRILFRQGRVWGIVVCLACMLGTQMNKLIETNSLKENSIIRVDRVMVNAIDKQNGR